MLAVDAPCASWAHEGGHRGSRSAHRPRAEKLKRRVGSHEARVFKLRPRSEGRCRVQSVGAVGARTRQRLRKRGRKAGAALCAVQQRRGFFLVAQRAELLEGAPAEGVRRQRLAKVRHGGLGAVRFAAHEAQQELARGAAGHLLAAVRRNRKQGQGKLRRTSSPGPEASACSASDSSASSTQATANR